MTKREAEVLRAVFAEVMRECCEAMDESGDCRDGINAMSTLLDHDALRSEHDEAAGDLCRVYAEAAAAEADAGELLARLLAAMPVSWVVAYARGTSVDVRGAL